MTSLVFKGIAARKLRTVLTAIAIVLGAAMVTGTLIVGHTVKGGFHEWYTQANGTSAAVISRTPHRPRLQRRRRHPDTPARLLARRAGAAGPRRGSCRRPRAGKLDRDRSLRQRDRRGGPPSLVSSTITDPKLTPLHLVDGRMPSKGNEIAIDTWSASQAKTQIGGTIKLATETPTRTTGSSG